jgi:hypothetical protein
MGERLHSRFQNHVFVNDEKKFLGLEVEGIESGQIGFA